MRVCVVSAVAEVVLQWIAPLNVCGPSYLLRVFWRLKNLRTCVCVCNAVVCISVFYCLFDSPSCVCVCVGGWVWLCCSHARLSCSSPYVPLPSTTTRCPSPTASCWAPRSRSRVAATALLRSCRTLTTASRSALVGLCLTSSFLQKQQQQQQQQQQ
jgi:hypothetical protein